MISPSYVDMWREYSGRVGVMMVSTAVLELLVCPVCGLSLALQDRTVRCDSAHSFDLAKEGYVNLLRKKLPGDTKEMVVARRTFFDRQYYLPVSDLLNTLMLEHLPLTGLAPVRLLDAGCGEGYYLGRLHEQLVARGEQVVSLGIDISKDAVRMAAKRYPASFFMVANLKETLPLADASLAGLLNIFAPRHVTEYARILSHGGLLLIVMPGPSHLQQLRETLQLLSIEENKQQHVIEQFSSLFDVLETRHLTYELPLSQEEVEQVVMMTPNYWHMTAEIRARMTALGATTTTVDFVCLLLKRK